MTRIFNLEHFPRIFGTVYRFLGSTGGPKVTRIFRMMAAKSKNELYAHLAELSSHPSLKRIIMSHGKRIEDKASDVLRDCWRSLRGISQDTLLEDGLDRSSRL